MEVFFNGSPMKKDFENILDTSYSIYSLSLIAYTRDIYLGRGQYYTAYMMLEVLLHKDINLFDTIFAKILNIDGEHPYGSYKDIKYFCEYIRKESTILCKRDIYHHIIRKFIQPQLTKDKNSDTPSLLAKWLPREKGKFGWLVKEIAWCCYNEGYDLMSHALKQYREDIVTINKRLETPQIYMAANKWSDIKEFRGATLRLHERAFRSIINDDRIKCSQNLSERPPPFNKSLMTPQYLVNNSLLEKDPLYDFYWPTLVKSYPKCKKYIPAVDCIEGIGFALIVAESAELHHVYSDKSINICMPFNDKVREVKNSITSLKIDYLEDNFIIFSNKECDITKYGDLRIVHWNVTGIPTFPRQEKNITIVSGNDSLMLKCFLKGELSFESMLNDSRYKF